MVGPCRNGNPGVVGTDLGRHGLVVGRTAARPEAKLAEFVPPHAQSVPSALMARTLPPKDEEEMATHWASVPDCWGVFLSLTGLPVVPRPSWP